MKIESYKDLIVWQKAVELTIEVYRVTKNYPKNETYVLASHTRKTAVSIPSNIAEGWNRKHRPEYLQSLNIAVGSAAELETQLIIANRLMFLPTEDFQRINGINTEVMKMLNALINILRTSDTNP